jgi:hypothetical protein
VGHDVDLGPDNTSRADRVTSIRGRRVLVFSGTNAAADNAPKCLMVFLLTRGVGGVAVTDARFGTDPCGVARAVATAIITRTG